MILSAAAAIAAGPLLAAGLGVPATGASAGFSAEQLGNARAIVAAAQALDLGPQAATLGVTAALGESGLLDLDHGDGAINPDGTVADSVGLFQQQHWWGPLSVRMDPSRSATSFYLHLEAVPGWQTMTPTLAIHAVQGNADPDYYTRYVAAGSALTADLLATQPPIAPVAAPIAPVAVSAPSAPQPSGFDAGGVDVEQQVQAAFAAGIGLPGTPGPTG